MKKIFWLTALVILVFAGCVTEPEVVETPVEEKSAAPVEEAVQEPVFVDVYLPVAEVLISSDGVIDGFVEYDYDEEGVLLEKRELDSERKLLTRLENSVSGGNIVRTQYYRGEESEPGIYKVLEYSGNRLVVETSFDQKDVAQTISQYEYDNDGNVVKWTVSSGDNVPMMVTEYEYDGKRRTKALFLTPLGESEGYIDYLWDGDLLVAEKTFDHKDNLEKAVEYTYEGDFLKGETHYRKTVVSHSIEYDLDEAGNPLVKKHFYRSGNLKAQWEYDYISVKKEVLE